MKIDIMLDLKTYLENAETDQYQQELCPEYYTTKTFIKNLHLVYGDKTDKFDEIARCIFIAHAYEFENAEPQDTEAFIEQIKKSLIKKAIQQQFDF